MQIKCLLQLIKTHYKLIIKKNIMNFKKIYTALFLLGLIALEACTKEKQNDIVVPTAMAEFPTTSNTQVSGVQIGTYFIKDDPNSVFNIPVGISNYSGKGATNVTFTVTSPTNAALGAQYNLVSPSVTIPAGQVLDSIRVKGLFAGYPVGRKDTLVFTITGGDFPAFPNYNVYKLVTQKYCDVVLGNLTGLYSNSSDAGYGPYVANVASGTSTGATSAKLVIKNFGQAYWGPFAPTDPTVATGIAVNIDWSNPASFKASIPKQPFYTDATYGPAMISGSGTFSSCANTITVTYTVSVAAGNFTAVTTTLKR
jgi:hypothetical protein